MKLSFDDVRNTQQGAPALIVAHGPSSNEYLDKIAYYKNLGFVIVGTNDWFLFHDEEPHYSVMANSVFTIQTKHVIFNRYNTKLVYADSVDATPKEMAEQVLKVDYLPYDQRHFMGMPCGCGACCSRIDGSRLTIQEELQKYCNADKHYGTGDTVALHQIAFAILLGCNPIYFVGVDLDYRLGFARNTGNKTSKSVHIGAINDYRDNILKDMQTIKEMVTPLGVKIVNLNKASTWDVFEIGEIDEGFQPNAS